MFQTEMQLKNVSHQLLKKNSVGFFWKKILRKKSDFVNQGKKIAVIGAPFNKGQNKDGAQLGPCLLRSTGFTNDLIDLGYSVQNYEDIHAEEEPHDPPIGKVLNTKSVGKICRKISETVCKIVKEGEVCITLGGDRSISIGTVLGHAQANPNMCLLYIDAHPNINTTLTTSSGSLNSISASYFFHELHAYNEKLPGLEWIKPSLSAKDIVYIGLRDVHPMERMILKKFGFLAYSMREVDQIGIKEVVSRALDAVNPNLERPIHVSLDLDALDTTVTPCTSLPVLGGFTLREGLYIAEEIYKTGKIAALDVVEMNPATGTRDDYDNTLYAARRMLGAFFGGYRGGNLPLGVTELPPCDSN